jgi:hypothetical protein
MGGVNPWHALRARTDVVVEYGWLRGCRGRTIDHGEYFTVTLDARLDRVARRCVLAHELKHIELNEFFTREHSGRIVARAEAAVRRAVAADLVPLDELEAYARARVGIGAQLDLVDVAIEFDVEPDVARIAVLELREMLADELAG